MNDEYMHATFRIHILGLAEGWLLTRVIKHQFPPVSPIDQVFFS